MNITNRMENSTKEKLSFIEKHPAVEQFKLLESQEAQDDLRIARAMGSNSIVIAEREVGKAMEIKRLADHFSGGIVLIKDVEKTCINFRLRFLQAEYFRGNLPIDVIHSIKQFAKETGTDISDASLEKRFYIMAPPSEFKLNKLNLTFPKIDMDPVLIYNIDGVHGRIVKKWGKDLTWIRWLKAIPYRTSAHFTTAVILAALLLIATLVIVMPHSHTDFTKAQNWGMTFCVIGLIVTVASGVLSVIIAQESSNRWLFSEHNWNNTNTF